MKFNLRLAESEDVPAIFGLIQSLAQYENLAHLVTGSPAALHEDLFGSNSCIECLVAESTVHEGQPVPQIIGFALFFTNYSTFLTRRGIYLEDLFVLPQYRRKGIGKAMISKVAEIALDRRCGRFEWAVLDWNTPAINFYQQLGAEILPDWRICRATGAALQSLAHCA
ncbi:MAG: GNAT family N-acetyltransferase [Pseudanabaenaceae cyanobacterium]|jgi:GNAT superfamily N-acetyltransferase